MKINKETRQLAKGLLRASIVDGKLDAAFGETFLIGTDRQELTVDQHAIAIEDDEIPAHYG